MFNNLYLYLQLIVTLILKKALMFKIIVFAILSLFSNILFADAVLQVRKVDDNVYALVGELSQRSKDNLANNSTHGVIVTDDGVILIDSGGSYLGAEHIHKVIQTITDKPIKIVINTGGQDHRWLGNEYYQKLGARIIASSYAQDDQKSRADSQMSRLDNLIGDSLKNTNPVFATETFDSIKPIELGKVKLELHYFGPAHTVGDIIAWMPNKRIMFAGDIVFNNRMLGIGPARNFQSWIDVFEKMASFKPSHIVPGHGDPSNLQEATKNTYQYLVFLKSKIAEILDKDGDMQDALKIDQSKYNYLKNHESIAGKNAQWVFQQMEFDY
ncbi:MAG: MBL fold metallo-hydrolase [Gammaproteobacteria bacterium]|nr:MBL fold metallo-hydrolase [Gammaproteobacteria bacterium]